MIKASIVAIGDELLIGQVIDTNSAWLGKQLNNQGIEVVVNFSIGDENERIKSTLKLASECSDLVLLTGGLGPTKDDITKKALAEYFNVPMYFDENIYRRIEQIFDRRGFELREVLRLQSYMPEGVKLLENNMGTAPGMYFEKEGTIYVSMPGVPYEMKAIFKNELLTILKEKTSDQVIFHRTIMTVGNGETNLAALIEDIENELANHLKIAYLPSLGKVRIRVSGKGTEQIKLEKEVNVIVDEIVEKIKPFVYGFDGESQVASLGKLLVKKGLMIGTTESCTGGFVSQSITKTPGSSAFFNGSAITYSNELKIKILNVSEQTLKDFGAVSEETVKEMVLGGIKCLNVDVCVAISGIAGPTGGTKEKPVGTVWLACGNAEKLVTKKLQLSNDRIKNIEYSSNYALNMIRKFILAMEN